MDTAIITASTFKPCVTIAAGSSVSVLQLLKDAFESFGFEINWSPGKTEALVELKGKCARAVTALAL